MIGKCCVVNTEQKTCTRQAKINVWSSSSFHTHFPPPPLLITPYFFSGSWGCSLQRTMTKGCSSRFLRRWPTPRPILRALSASWRRYNSSIMQHSFIHIVYRSIVYRFFHYCRYWVSSTHLVTRDDLYTCLYMNLYIYTSREYCFHFLHTGFILSSLLTFLLCSVCCVTDKPRLVRQDTLYRKCVD